MSNEYSEDLDGIAWGEQHQKPSKLVTEMPHYKPVPRKNPMKPQRGANKYVSPGHGGTLGKASPTPMYSEEELERFSNQERFYNKTMIEPRIHERKYSSFD